MVTSCLTRKSARSSSLFSNRQWRDLGNLASPIASFGGVRFLASRELSSDLMRQVIGLSRLPSPLQRPFRARYGAPIHRLLRAYLRCECRAASARPPAPPHSHVPENDIDNACAALPLYLDHVGPFAMPGNDTSGDNIVTRRPGVGLLDLQLYRIAILPPLTRKRISPVGSVDEACRVKFVAQGIRDW